LRSEGLHEKRERIAIGKIRQDRAHTGHTSAGAECRLAALAAVGRSNCLRRLGNWKFVPAKR
jgi:hypothetical protein